MRNITLWTYTLNSPWRRGFLLNAGMVYGITLAPLMHYGWYDFQNGAVWALSRHTLHNAKYRYIVEAWSLVKNNLRWYSLETVRDAPYDVTFAVPILGYRLKLTHRDDKRGKIYNPYSIGLSPPGCNIGPKHGGVSVMPFYLHYK